MKGMNVGAFVMGAVVGGIVLGSVALLYAPCSGPTLRRRLRRNVTRTVEDLTDIGREAFDQAKETATELVQANVDRAKKLSKSPLMALAR